MAHIRRQPYSCARCGVVAHDSKGIPVLTINGLVDSYEIPYNWGWLGQDLGCSDCLVKFVSEIEEAEANSIYANLVSVVQHNFAETDARIVATAAEKLAAYYRKRAKRAREVERKAAKKEGA